MKKRVIGYSLISLLWLGQFVSNCFWFYSNIENRRPAIYLNVGIGATSLILAIWGATTAYRSYLNIKNKEKE